ncbi:hypothetical protein EVAR_22982_1 [Eumeta japonica]|uniref:Uncharacterized protein n=1 Tax=Eumeta variegata TaxID=151549 RepID=A0A4C1UQB2_EUMVA|nr:hypothetical protein EVAR_22982_1 [Eumeta japonica]
MPGHAYHRPWTLALSEESPVRCQPFKREQNIYRRWDQADGGSSDKTHKQRAPANDDCGGPRPRADTPRDFALLFCHERDAYFGTTNV